jgi:hypothetical protein
MWWVNFRLTASNDVVGHELLGTHEQGKGNAALTLCSTSTQKKKKMTGNIGGEAAH